MRRAAYLLLLIAAGWGAVRLVRLGDGSVEDAGLLDFLGIAALLVFLGWTLDSLIVWIADTNQRRMRRRAAEACRRAR